MLRRTALTVLSLGLLASQPAFAASDTANYGKNHDYNNDPAFGGAVDTGRCESLADSADTAQVVAMVGYRAAVVETDLANTFWLTDRPAVESTGRAGASLTCVPGVAGASRLCPS